MDYADREFYFVEMKRVSSFYYATLFIGLITLIGLLVSCESREEKTLPELEEIPLDYAEGFQVYKGENFYLIEVTQPWTGAEQSFRYLVTDEAEPSYSGNIDALVSPNPTRLILTSTTQIPHLDLLGITGNLVGFPNLDLISSDATRKLIREGSIVDLGSGPQANPEMVIDLEPDLMMISTLGEDLKYLEVFQRAGIPAVINGEYVEQHPLGRAEWIKFTGILTGKFEQSITEFEEIEKSYQEAVNLVAELPITEKPKILSGVMYQDIWYAPGSDSWGARILDNAGGDYIFKDQKGTGSLQLNYEYVLDKAIDADLWIGSADFSSIQEMGEAEQRYTPFKSFKDGEVYSYTLKKGETGGLEYFELGYIRPDLILKDMVKIIHPELLLDYELYFYQKLNER